MSSGEIKTSPVGQTFRSFEDPTHYDPKYPIEASQNFYQDRVYPVKCASGEFSAVCPKTGMPDIYELIITYYPHTTIIELKSLKFFLTEFRDVGMFGENIANVIADHIDHVISPHYVNVQLTQGVRGGIETMVNATRGTVPDETRIEMPEGETYEVMG